ncbi:MAG TPA: riboflavin synthase [Solirubrobacteraceae bacterium]|nr:riboflavin synthase [Solirubrobacteraceae bacterium]
MFTGLIGDLGQVRTLEPDGAGTALEIETQLGRELKRGDSVAVNGVCLTATEVSPSGFRAHAVPETLRRSSLGGLRVGARVNLERALRAADPLGGHIVQGHVDATGVVRGVRTEGESRVLDVRLDERLVRYLVEKGSVALDGVSLTVSGLLDDGFEVSLIPETLARTTLGQLTEGAEVNVEVDILAKHVERLLEVRA